MQRLTDTQTNWQPKNIMPPLANSGVHMKHFIKSLQVSEHYVVNSCWRCFRTESKFLDREIDIYCNATMLVEVKQCITQTITIIYTPCLKKTVQNCFCHNFVKFSPILIIFGRNMVKRLKLCKVHSFSTSPNSHHHTTVLKCKCSKLLHNAVIISIRLLCILSSIKGATWFNKFVG